MVSFLYYLEREMNISLGLKQSVDFNLVTGEILVLGRRGRLQKVSKDKEH